MRQTLIWAMLPVLVSAPAMSQDPSPTGAVTSVYLEVAGPTEFASLNLERLVSDQWALRGGFQIAGSGRSLGEHYVQLPMSMSRVQFIKGFGLEAGVGAVATINGQYHWDAFEYFGSVGLRTRPFAGGAFLRVEVLALPSEDWQKSFGVGVGYTF